MGNAAFQGLSAEDKRGARRVAQELSGRWAHLLDKDIWVVKTLGVLFGAPFGADLVFKGGTSLAKGHNVICRFSEVIDITYDIRAFAPNLAADAGEEAIPTTCSQEQRCSKAIWMQLSAWVEEQGLPVIEEALGRADFGVRVRADGERLYVGYEPLPAGGCGFVEPRVMVEFGARSTGKPCEYRPVVCEAAPFLPYQTFLNAARVSCWPPACSEIRRLPRISSADNDAAAGVEHLSRHWHDLVRLSDSGIATTAVADHGLAR